jgi:hypothetical protein
METLSPPAYVEAVSGRGTPGSDERSAKAKPSATPAVAITAAASPERRFITEEYDAADRLDSIGWYCQ